MLARMSSADLVQTKGFGLSLLICTLRQLVIDALQREIAGTERPRKRLVKPPIKLAADAPLHRLSPEAVKRIDTEDLLRSEESKARALHR
ncbi:MAG: hypothetical protein U1F67_21705 [Rubrivivax sp.]